jgi:hypothetical protein
VTVKAGPSDSDSAALDVWGNGRLLRSTVVPKALHGGIVNDGYFAAGMAWSPDEVVSPLEASPPGKMIIYKWVLKTKIQTMGFHAY